MICRDVPWRGVQEWVRMNVSLILAEFDFLLFICSVAARHVNPFYFRDENV